MKKQKLKYNIRTYNCLDPVGYDSRINVCLSELWLMQISGSWNSGPWRIQLPGLAVESVNHFLAAFALLRRVLLACFSGALSNFQSLILTLLCSASHWISDPWPSPSPGTVPPVWAYLLTLHTSSSMVPKSIYAHFRAFLRPFPPSPLTIESVILWVSCISMFSNDTWSAAVTLDLGCSLDSSRMPREVPGAWFPSPEVQTSFLCCVPRAEGCFKALAGDWTCSQGCEPLVYRPIQPHAESVF